MDKAPKPVINLMCVIGENNICDFRPGEEHLREMVDRPNKTFIGSAIDLECKSAAFKAMCPRCDTIVKCHEEKDKNGVIQPYWGTTKDQVAYCYGECP